MNQDRIEETQVFRPADAGTVNEVTSDTQSNAGNLTNQVSPTPPPVTDADVEREIAPMESPDTQMLEQVHEGMKVVDAAGDDLGKVDYVKMGDPEAVTVDSVPPGNDGLLTDVAEAFGAEAEPKVAPSIRRRLLRFGYFKIDGKGWIDTDRYVPSDKIADVMGDTVRLSVTKENLPQAS
ncbi:MAG TPA: hypothetical protein VFL82_16280 [Thermomicrobiales bacterium]|nr:hypothetical protein [Thermomicrobiales bacterium]